MVNEDSSRNSEDLEARLLEFKRQLIVSPSPKEEEISKEYKDNIEKLAEKYIKEGKEVVRFSGVDPPANEICFADLVKELMFTYEDMNRRLEFLQYSIKAFHKEKSWGGKLNFFFMYYAAQLNHQIVYNFYSDVLKEDEYDSGYNNSLNFFVKLN